jgi:predicted metal-dependent hydrolase
MGAGRGRRKIRVRRLDVRVRDRTVPLTIRRHPHAKRIILRLDENGDGAVVTVPTFAHDDDALAMVRAQADWLLARLGRAPKRLPFADGAAVPVRGVEHVVRHQPGRGAVKCEGGEIVVFGGVEHLPRRLTDWFRAEARRAITAIADEKTERLGVKRGRITVRDTRTRWGSCAAGGNLSFSWRLIMAPDHVLDYVVAHEVAHLKHLDHSPAFWAAVDEITEHAETAKAWLNSAGMKLHLYG